MRAPLAGIKEDSSQFVLDVENPDDRRSLDWSRAFSHQGTLVINCDFSCDAG